MERPQTYRPTLASWKGKARLATTVIIVTVVVTLSGHLSLRRQQATEDPAQSALLNSSRRLKGDSNFESGSATASDIDLSGLVIELPTIEFDFDLCFSGETTVQVQNRMRPVLLKDLQVGDYVLTGGNTYQPVYAFAHRNPTKEAEFLQIVTTANSSFSKQQHQGPLEITDQHLLFVQGQHHPVRAESVRVGDILRGGKTVVRIDRVSRRGVYAPLTEAGEIVVNGVVASSYVTLQKGEDLVTLQGFGPTLLSQHGYVHRAMSPFRLVCTSLRNNSSLCRPDNDEGMPLYVSFGIALTKWIHRQSMVIQGGLLLVVLMVSGVCSLVESIIAALSWWTIVGTLVALLWFLRSRLSQAPKRNTHLVRFTIYA